MKSFLARRPPVTLREKGRYLLLSLLVLTLDQWSKWLVEAHLPLHAVEPLLPGWVNLVHIRNPGVAFGLFAAGPGRGAGVLGILGLVALLGVLVYFGLTHTRDRLLLIALALVMGGAAGNLMDRLAAGAVTDFVDLQLVSWHWPAFNLADLALTCGILVMVWDLLRAVGSPSRPERGAGPAVRPPGEATVEERREPEPTAP